MFPFKDKPDNIKSQSLDVYHLKCNNCEANYIGKSKRILNLRINEHEDENKEVLSALAAHTKENKGHSIDHDNIKILDRASNDQKLVWKEMLHIRKLKPSLNSQINSKLHT